MCSRIFLIVIFTEYVHLSSSGACCLKCTNNNNVCDFHERCVYGLPPSQCKMFCNQDSNCKGFVGVGNDRCQLATNSTCSHASGGKKYNAGKEGDLFASCGGIGDYGGCYAKKSSGMK